MKTIGQEIKEASETCTATDLTRPLDRLKNDDGSLDEMKLRKLISQLKAFGPYYKDVLNIIVNNLNDKE